jgi:contact-dependent growth inhibition (CDI) system CdiI-like immunity protein
MNEQPVADDDSSLEQIECDVWGDPPAGATHLITTVHRLRRKPVGALSAEDLRMLIAQRVGLDVLVPRALVRLEGDPLAEGDFYPGDLLVATLKTPVDYWATHPDQLARLDAVAESVAEPDADLAADINGFRERTTGITR